MFIPLYDFSIFYWTNLKLVIPKLLMSQKKKKIVYYKKVLQIYLLTLLFFKIDD